MKPIDFTKATASLSTPFLSVSENAAASETPGTLRAISSTIFGLTLTPARFMTSLVLPVICKRPKSSRNPKSPG